MIVVVTGLPASGKTTTARGLAAELRLPLFSLDAIKEALYDAPGGGDRAPVELRLAAEAVLRVSLRDAPGGAVIDIWLDPTRADRERLRAMLPTTVETREIFCDVPAETSGRRYAARSRHGVHRGADAELLQRIEQAGRLLAADSGSTPAGLGPVLRVNTTREVVIADLAAWVTRPAD